MVEFVETVRAGGALGFEKSRAGLIVLPLAPALGVHR